MIKVNIYTGNENFISRFKIHGHSNFAPYGEDIICAAVSILGHTTLKSLVDVCGLKEDEISYRVDEETGFLDVRMLIPEFDKRIVATQVVFKTFVVGIKSLVESYPKYVTLEYRGGVMNA